MPIVFDFERKILLDYARSFKVDIVFKKLGVLGKRKIYRMIIRGFCPFYSIENRACKIHKIKPLSCKIYPLLLDIKGKKLMISMLCEWVRRNKITELPIDEVLDMFKEEVNYLLKIVELIQGC